MKTLKVLKTIKLFINGDFVRTESGRSFKMNNNDGETYANMSLASRKDFRNAVVAAKSAQTVWAKKTAYNRSQILYRMAEMAEGKITELENAITETTETPKIQAQLIAQSIVDTFVFYAGFCDKYQQLMSCINPVAGPHHNFTTVDAVGVVGLFADKEVSMQLFMDQLCSALTSSNSVVALLPKKYAAILAPLSEVLATSDLPKGVVNLLTGDQEELGEHFASHFELNSLCYLGDNSETKKHFKKQAAKNMKRIVLPKSKTLELENILNFVEYKTVWHPA
ncbi:MAG: aldehyde dehydrogenase family protein [Bdellovibrionaceae bacterium]|jgi:acyl-CoA reductase-like NAD-dependent aldehyde dehydrogenase|nr:aldehyde dehydrogenase family protein [Pseudobdellovibrionaceae bacterium]